MAKNITEKELEKVDGGYSDKEYQAVKNEIQGKIKRGEILCKKCHESKPDSLILRGGRCNENGLSFKCKLCNEPEFYTWKDLGVKEY